MARKTYKISEDKIFEEFDKFNELYANKRIGFLMIFVDTDSKGEKVYTAHERTNQPCYGEMRPYAAQYPDLLPESQREVSRPLDLYDPFPKEGTPYSVSVPFRRWFSQSKKNHNQYAEALVSKEGPWRTVTQDVTLSYNSDGWVTGIRKPSADFDPTVFLNLLLFQKGTGSNGCADAFAKITDLVPNTSVGFRLLSSIAFPINAGKFRTPMHPGNYFLNPNFEVYRFINGDPIDLTDGGTWEERYAYNRPEIQNVFGAQKEAPHYRELEKIITGSESAESIIESVSAVFE